MILFFQRYPVERHNVGVSETGPDTTQSLPFNGTDGISQHFELLNDVLAILACHFVDFSERPLTNFVSKDYTLPCPYGTYNNACTMCAHNAS